MCRPYVFFKTHSLVFNSIDNPLRKITGPGRWCSLVLLDNYDRLADFFVYKLTAEENDCMKVVNFQCRF